MGRMDRNMQMVAIMQKFHWSYQDYEEAPIHVITLIREKMMRDMKEKELANKRKQRGQ